MADLNHSDVNKLSTTPAYLCPFLATRDDSETYSANADFKNYCHKASPVAPVDVDQQRAICCTENYRDCMVYQATQPLNLPPEWLYVESVTSPRNENRWGWLLYAGVALIGIVVVVFLYLYWFSGLINNFVTLLGGG